MSGFAAGSVDAQGVVNGSSGADGPLDVATNTTLALPPDGVFHFTTVHVRPGARLTFAPNALNTPVYLLATGDIVIEGTISVNGGNASTTSGGVGGPGGYAGGTPGDTGVSPGAGLGPGGGLGGTLSSAQSGGAGGAGYRTQQAVDANQARRGGTYGSPLLVPLVGGSGGGGTTGTPGWGGGGGAGAILVASDARIQLAGRIEAMGGSGVATGATCSSRNHGSGGAIRLVAPTVLGTGSLDVRGGVYGAHCGDTFRAGAGRTRVDSIYRAEANLAFVPTDGRTFGTYLVAMHLSQPRVDIVEAAGTAVTGDAPVFITLPFGTPSTQNVRVSVSGFPASANLRVRLTPSSGDPTTYGPFPLAVNAGSVEQVISVEIPPNNPTHIQAWAE